MSSNLLMEQLEMLIYSIPCSNYYLNYTLLHIPSILQLMKICRVTSMLMKQNKYSCISMILLDGPCVSVFGITLHAQLSFNLGDTKSFLFIFFIEILGICSNLDCYGTDGP